MLAWTVYLSFLGVLVLMLVGFSSCAHKTQISQTSPPQQASPALAPTARHTLSLFWKEGEEEAWHRFIKDARYRMAQPADFRHRQAGRR